MASSRPGWPGMAWMDCKGSGTASTSSRVGRTRSKPRCASAWVRICLHDAADHVEVDLVARRVVWRGEHDDVRAHAFHGANRLVLPEVVGKSDALVHDGAARDDREPLVHRVRGLEQQRLA